MTYADVHEVMVASLTTQAEGLKSTARAYAYKGFSPSDVFANLVEKAKAANLTTAQFSEDMVNLIVIFLARGPNVGKVTSTNSQGNVDLLVNIVTRYGIKSKAPVIFMVHNMYQSMLSKKTDIKEDHKSWLPSDYIQTSTRYAMLASRGSLLAGTQIASAADVVQTKILLAARSILFQCDNFQIFENIYNFFLTYIHFFSFLFSSL